MKRQLHKYWTGLQTQHEEFPQPRPPYKGAGWRAGLGVPVNKNHMTQQGKEVVLYASSWVSAQRALNLIHGCHLLVRGDPDIFPFHPIASNNHEPSWMDKDGHDAMLKNTYLRDYFPVACAIAAKASRRRKYVYAVAKYKFSISIFAVHHIDLDPRRSPYLKISLFPGDHVMFAYAIISAYSAIEDLGLQVGASGKKPSRLNNGSWNPEIKNKLEERLIRAGVNLRETILWTLRGSKRRIEMKRAVPSVTKVPWSSKNIRDCELNIIDAIAYAEWLRSTVASHGTKITTISLSPYDVINVQHVARRLLMECLGFWDWQRELIKKSAKALPSRKL